MIVKFKHPPTGTKNPLKDFNPNNKKHYPDKKGIYIHGLRLVIGIRSFFVPIIVGIGDNCTLKKRLKDHYNKNKTKGKGLKELWNFKSIKSMPDLNKIYSEMYFYDCINNGQNENDRTSEEYLRMLTFLKKLLFFQNKNFFNLKEPGKTFLPLLTEEERELNHMDAINNYLINKSEIQDIKDMYKIDFYYVFASYDEINEQILQNENDKKLFSKLPTVKKKLERIELATKKALNIIGIHTTAKAQGEILDMDIDLSDIQNELVNMGGHPYNENGNYKKSLIINIRK